MAKSYVMALDCGTTGNRSIIFDENLKVAGQAYKEFAQYYPKPGWVEHDAAEIWNSVRSVIRKAHLLSGKKKITAIGITNQRETLVVWDCKTGKPATKAIVWQCRRSADICSSWKKKGYEKTFHRKTGLFLDPYFSGSKLTWMMKNIPSVRNGIRSGRLIAGTIDTWVIWKLTGGKSFFTDVTNASRTLLYNLKAGRWDSELLKITGVPATALAEVKASCDSYGVTSVKEAGFEAEILGVAGDQQSAAFAQGCAAEGVFKNTYGTGLFVVSETGTRPVLDQNLITTVAASEQPIPRYAFEGSVFIGGAGVQWVRDGLKLIKNAADSEKIAASVADNGGVYFIPALAGLGCPYWDTEARGMFTGLTRGTTSAHMIRSVLEAMAYRTADVVEAMKKASSIRPKALRVDGGAVSNDFLMQFQSDILGIPVERPKITEMTALGAAALAGLKSGIWKNPQSFMKLNPIEKVFRPKMKPAVRKKLLQDWKEAVSRSLTT